MSYQVITWGLCFAAACWVIVIAHQVGWPALDPVQYGIWRTTLYIAYPTVFVTTGAPLAAFLLTLAQRK